MSNTDRPPLNFSLGAEFKPSTVAFTPGAQNAVNNFLYSNQEEYKQVEEEVYLDTGHFPVADDEDPSGSF